MVTENGIQVNFFLLFLFFFFFLFLIEFRCEKHLNFEWENYEKSEAQWKSILYDFSIDIAHHLVFLFNTVSHSKYRLSHSMSTQSSWKWIPYKLPFAFDFYFRINFIISFFCSMREKNHLNFKGEKISFAAIRSIKQ